MSRKRKILIALVLIFFGGLASMGAALGAADGFLD